MDSLTTRSAGPVLLLGEALVDDFVDGPIAGGAPLNVASSLAALGIGAHLASRINPGDAAGQLLLDSMRRFGLSEAGMQLDLAHASGLVSVAEAADGSHQFEIHGNAAWDYLQPAPVLHWLEANTPRLVYFGSLARRSTVSRNTLRRVLAALPRNGIPRYLDLNLRSGAETADIADECLREATWVKLSDDELWRVAQWFGLACDMPDETDRLLQAGRALMARYALDRLVVTRGDKGYVGFDGHGAPAMGSAQPLVRRVDTVGAGDAFSAMLLAAVLQGRAWPASLALANGMAAAMCGERGPVPAKASFFNPWRAALSAKEAA